MNKGILIALPLFLFLHYMAVSQNLPDFLDTASMLIVLGGAVSFALCGSGAWFSDSRLTNAAEGAVIAGWLGALLLLQLVHAVSTSENMAVAIQIRRMRVCDKSPGGVRRYIKPSTLVPLSSAQLGHSAR